MKTVKDIVISRSEPPVNNVGWLKPLSNGTFMLFFFGDKGWTPISIESSGELKFNNNMGKIKKILENELVGGTESTDIYPVTSIKAVYDENNERLDNNLNRVKKEIIYDVSARNNNAVFESLSDLLSSPDLNTLIPTSVRHGGMSIRFIQGSVLNPDNKYVQWRYIGTSITSNNFTNVENWQL